jgi:Ser/Thr protein kinase RdoA (MazF antagonist)
VVLPGGPVSRSFRVELAGLGPAVLRIDRRRELPPARRGADARDGGAAGASGHLTLAAALGLDRAAEHRWLAALAPAGLAPAPIAVDAAAGLSLRAWLPGRPGATLEALVAALARLHRHPVPAGLATPRDWRATLARYARLAGPAGEGAAADATIRLLDLDSGPARASVWSRVNCHHDPGPGNFVAGAARFLDWEYAAVGNPLFDIAVAGQGLGLAGGRDWARLAAAYAAAGGVVPAPVAAGSLPAWAAFATAVGRLWVVAVTGWSCS